MSLSTASTNHNPTPSNVNSTPFLWRTQGLQVYENEGSLVAKVEVYAPGIDAAALVGDFNHWQPDACPLHFDPATGIWSGAVKNINVGQCYKFLFTRSGRSWYKADPFARQSQLRPNDASVVTSPSPYIWRDKLWCQRDSASANDTLLIFEIHLSSWRKQDHNFFNYRELAHELADHVISMGFTHVELLPITEHLVDESMGYQVTGYFSPTARHGTPNDLKYFIDVLHARGIGVILDWVPAHFSSDACGLSQFNGAALYEPAQFFNRKNWGTHTFDFSQTWVRNFLIANALYWLEEFHFDGLRVDAVSALLYKNFLRDTDEWQANSDGTDFDYHAIDFLRDLTQACKRHHPNCILIAEESTGWAGVTASIENGGLGFDYAWNMGWINDTKKFFSLQDRQIRDQRKLITFSAVYLFNERYIHSLSHDEIGPESDGMYALSPYDIDLNLQEKKAALFLFYLYTLPGHKLLFAGTDMGLMSSWSPTTSLSHRDANPKFQEFIRALNRINQDQHFSQSNQDASAFAWIDCFEVNDYCVAFRRTSATCEYYVFINFASTPCDYPIGIDGPLHLVIGLLDDTYPDLLTYHSNLPLPGFSGAIYQKDL